MRPLALLAALVAVLTFSVTSEAVERHRERDHSTVAAPDTAAPRVLTLIGDQGSPVDNAVYYLKFANSYRIRGVMTSIAVVGSECTLTLKVNGVTVNTFSLVGKAARANYIALGPDGLGVDVPAGEVVTLKTEVTGTNTGLLYQLDTIP